LIMGTVLVVVDRHLTCREQMTNALYLNLVVRNASSRPILPFVARLAHDFSSFDKAISFILCYTRSALLFTVYPIV
jgi:hypothetical protein